MDNLQNGRKMLAEIQLIRNATSLDIIGERKEDKIYDNLFKFNWIDLKNSGVRDYNKNLAILISEYINSLK